MYRFNARQQNLKTYHNIIYHHIFLIFKIYFCKLFCEINSILKFHHVIHFRFRIIHFDYRINHVSIYESHLLPEIELDNHRTLKRT